VINHLAKKVFQSLLVRAKRVTLAQAEQGSATVTALIVVGLAAVLLAGLMWRQQMDVRTLENARDKLQAQYLQRAALDFARLVLVEDQRTSAYDHLGETWALPLADGKVADFLKSADVPDEIATVTFSGQLTDAQGLLNLSNLWDANVSQVNPPGIKAYERLLDALGLDPSLASQTAQLILQSNMPLNDLEGLLRLPGYSPQVLERLRPFVVILPTATTINVNTAPAEVLMAAIAGLSRGAAINLIAQRSLSPLKTLDEVSSLVSKVAPSGAAMDLALLDVKSSFWLARSEVRLGRGIFNYLALIERSRTPLPTGNFTRVVWSKSGKLPSE
jgi:general secretion pathway protein K